MLTKKSILFFGFTEIAIGTITLATIVQSLLMDSFIKPFNVLTFVVLSSIASLSLGIGVLLRREIARKLLIYFAGWIILSKVLIFAKLIILCCELETTMPSHLKNIVSVIYHAVVIFYFHHPTIKAEFKL